MLSTDSSNNRTIASTLKMQIRTVQRLRAQFNVLVDPLEVERRFQVRTTSCHLTFRSRFESQHQSVPGCAEECGEIRWPVADPGCGSRTRRRPTSPKRPRLGCRRSATTLYSSLTGPPLPAIWTHWTTSFGHTSRRSPTWPPQHQSQPDHCPSPSSRRRLWKRHAPSSGSVSRRWLRLKAATLNRCRLYYIIKLPELIFFNKSFKIKL